MTTIQDIADKLGISKSTVSKALNDAPDISETLQKQVLETAVELGYTKLRRYKKPVKKLCVIVQRDNIEYEEPHHFAYDIVMDSVRLPSLPVLKWQSCRWMQRSRETSLMMCLCCSMILPAHSCSVFLWASRDERP